MALSSKRGSCGGGGGEEIQAGGGVNNSICVVDGCGEDLSECRKYYQRHKVCEAHSKAPQVSIHGHYLRFCQQCSRFHPVDEFDEGKRSCRKRLDGHNRRRRKPRPDHNYNHNFNYNYNTPHQGTNMFQYAGPPVHPTMSPDLWSGVVEAPAPASTNSVDHTNYAPSLLSSYSVNLTLPQSTLTHVMHHPQSECGSSYGSAGSLTITGGSRPLNQLQGPDSANGLENDCDMQMGWGSMTTDDTYIDPSHCSTLDQETLRFYWPYE